MPKQSALTKQPSPARVKSTPEQSAAAASPLQLSASPEGALALQRSAGNKVAQAAGGATPPAAGGSAAIESWIAAEAAKDKKTALHGFYTAFGPMQRKIAINLFAGGSGAPSLAKAKKHLTGILGRSIDWDKFSKIIRTVNSQKTQNYNEDTDRDYVTYATTAAAASVGASSAAASTTGEVQGIVGAGKEGAFGAVIDMGPASAALSGVTAGVQIYNAVQNHDEAQGGFDKFENVVGEGASGAADLARFGATGVVNTQKFMGAAVSGAATAAAGAAGVVGGAAYLASGVAGVYTHGKRMNKLNALEKASAGKDADLSRAAGLGASTQKINKTKSAATALKGAAMVVGGGILLAAGAATPVGWLLLGVAGAIGGIAAVYKFYKKRTRKEEVVDRFLDVDKKLAELQAAAPAQKLEKSKVRETLLQKNGFNSVAQCYAQIVTDLAHTIYEKGVVGKDAQYEELLRNIGLNPDHTKRTPKPDLIAKKLHS
ncbi:hypothetical protein [Paenibacillus harenae]|uniref:Uncharacterized protein n=1 Tax=Paenibacillus harenae TaxID=306543 RepID=A0ABT9U4Q9_PAEHA|nr:hypothetical protein [Paenibacillus harenae]MDQ0113429.1 hypothetical protein [Paenibacillus harenae]